MFPANENQVTVEMPRRRGTHPALKLKHSIKCSHPALKYSIKCSHPMPKRLYKM